MEAIYRAGSDAEAGYLCDLLGQHDIAATNDARTIRVDAAHRERAQQIVQDAVAEPDDDRPLAWYRRVLRLGNRTVTIIVLLVLVFAVTTLMLGRADPLSVGVVLAMILVVLAAEWRMKAR